MVPSKEQFSNQSCEGTPHLDLRYISSFHCKSKIEEYHLVFRIMPHSTIVMLQLHIFMQTFVLQLLWWFFCFINFFLKVAIEAHSSYCASEKLGGTDEVGKRNESVHMSSLSGWLYANWRICINTVQILKQFIGATEQGSAQPLL